MKRKRTLPTSQLSPDSPIQSDLWHVATAYSEDDQNGRIKENGKVKDRFVLEPNRHEDLFAQFASIRNLKNGIRYLEQYGMLNESQRKTGIEIKELLEAASYVSWMGELIEAISNEDIALLKQWLHNPSLQVEDFFFYESEELLSAFLDSENSDRDQALANKLLQQPKNERYQSALFEVRQPSQERSELVEGLNKWIRYSKEQAIKGAKKSYYSFSPKGDEHFPHWNGIFIEQNFNNTLVGWKRIPETRLTQPLDSYPCWIYDHGSFDESRDTIILAMAFVQSVLNRNLLSVSPSLSFVSDLDGVIALGNRLSVRNPWQAIHLTMFYMVLGKSALKKCGRPDCITFFTAKRSDARVCKKKACQKWATRYLGRIRT